MPSKLVREAEREVSPLVSLGQAVTEFWARVSGCCACLNNSQISQESTGVQSHKDDLVTRNLHGLQNICPFRL